MKAYQDGIAKFEQADTQVFGISVDEPAANKKFADETGATFPLLSDTSKQVTKAYGILNEQYQFSNRTTFIVDKKGVIQYIEEGRTVIDPTGAVTLCTGLKKKDATK
ncbi:MAG: peroxiredoxin family protein [Acidobacteria bacterium]|nr:peroxiredoxin family protein [Acidobacteriota bacterium]MBI3664205.1 peroxiredoxin family protein [Acidobacteriota bacterium]